MPWLADKISEVIAVKGHSKRTAETYTHVEAKSVRCFVNLLAS